MLTNRAGVVLMPSLALDAHPELDTNTLLSLSPQLRCGIDEGLRNHLDAQTGKIIVAHGHCQSRGSMRQLTRSARQLSASGPPAQLYAVSVIKCSPYRQQKEFR